MVRSRLAEPSRTRRRGLRHVTSEEFLVCAKEVADARLAETVPTGVETRLVDGRYRIVRRLGRGSSKEVFLAHDLRLDREVALAIVPAGVRGTSVRERLNREAKLMARLDEDANVVTIYDISEDDGIPYVVARYMSGGSLADRLSQAPAGHLDVADAVRLATEIVGGLAHAHARGVVHRDVKPSNVWLDADGHAALGDFGIALSADETRLTAEGGLIGTALYVSPEQARGGPVDARSDLYSLGITLYEMLCGRPPFSGTTAMEVVAQHLEASPTLPAALNSAIPPAVERLVLALLAKLPDDRPRSADAVRAELSAAAAESDGGVGAPPPRGYADAPDAPLAVPERAPLGGGSTGAFVGRTSELGRLNAHLAAVVAGATRLVVLSGEPGIGKTRLVGELMRSARACGARVLYGGGDEDGTLSYQPFVEMLREYVPGEVDMLRAAGLEAELAEVGRLMPDARLAEPSRDTTGDPDLQRFRLFQAVASVFGQAAQTGPLVLVLDDLQWADRPTRQMLRHLVRSARLPRTLIVAVRRSEGVAALTSSLMRERDLDHITVGGLARAESQQLVATRMPAAEPALVARLVDDTDGNPLFLGEVLRSLDETGAADHETVLEELDLPDSITEVVEQRLRRLGSGTVDVLRAAAVAGRDFQLQVLQHALECSPERVLDAMDDALSAGLVTENLQVADHFSFSHAIVRSTLYNGQSASRRTRFHLKVGRALEASDDCRPAELAHHFWHARHVGGAERAFHSLLVAGRLADVAFAWEDAERHYRRALRTIELIDGADPAMHGQLLLALGDALEHGGNSVGAKQTFWQAAEHARVTFDQDLLAYAALGYGRAPGNATREDPDLLALLEEARSSLDASNHKLRARILGRLAVERSSIAGTRDEVDALSREAVALAERCGDDVVLAVALASRHWTLSRPDTLEERCRVARRSLELAVQAGDRERELSGRAWWLFDLLELGDVTGVEEQFAAYEALADSLRHPSYQGYALAIRAMLSLLRGEHDPAVSQVEGAHRLLQRAHDPDADRVRALQLFVLHHQQGEHQLAVKAVEGMPSTRPIWACLASWAWCEDGELERGGALVAPAGGGSCGWRVARNHDGVRPCRCSAGTRRFRAASARASQPIRRAGGGDRGHRVSRPGRTSARKSGGAAWESGRGGAPPTPRDRG